MTSTTAEARNVEATEREASHQIGRSPGTATRRGGRPPVQLTPAHPER
jgi:hypothetical protein